MSTFELSASLTLMPPVERLDRDASARLLVEAGQLSGMLAPPIRAAVGDMVRSMNCYYSNLIEGHDTLPRDIERAMKNDYSADPKKRDLQLEARSHIEVQAMIDHGEMDHLGLGEDLVRGIHREFCIRLPEELLFVEHPTTKEKLKIVPGEYREHDVVVGRHEPVSPAAVPSFMAHFTEGYAPSRIRFENAVFAAAAAHHRLVWIHPFLDGNGRVARLYSHAYLRRARVGCDIWSVARGLARTVTRYRDALARADWSPQGMSDGRGTLSNSGLVQFCDYVVATCLDQVRFMSSLLEPATLMARMRTFVTVEAAQGTLDARVLPVLTHALTIGDVPKAAASAMMGIQERQARRLLDPLIDRGFLSDGGSKFAPWRLAFPISESEILFPRLFAPVGVPDVTPAAPADDEWGSEVEEHDDDHPHDGGGTPSP
ncbi:MAG TPA: Fic family protein [Telmatospirillum sp.]|nr:Fic family protein [Telmatospirillum sp.]